MTEARRCWQCGETWPLTDQYFRPNREVLSKKCRTCIYADGRRYYADNRADRNAAARAYRKSEKGIAARERRKVYGKTKTCRKCGETYPATPKYFYRERNGLRARCKACIDAQVKAYVEVNKSWLYAYQKDWKAKNRKHVQAQRKRYYKRNRERMIEQRKAYAKTTRFAGRIYEQRYRLQRKIRRLQEIQQLVRGA